MPHRAYVLQVAASKEQLQMAAKVQIVCSGDQLKTTESGCTATSGKSTG